MASLKSRRFSLRSTLPHLFRLLQSYDLSNKIIDSECDTRRRKFMKELNYLIILMDIMAGFCDFNKGTYYRGHEGSEDLFTLNNCWPPFHSYGKDTGAASTSWQSACSVRSCVRRISIAEALQLEDGLECLRIGKKREGGKTAGQPWSPHRPLGGITTARGHEAICIKVPREGIGINGLEVCTGLFDL